MAIDRQKLVLRFLPSLADLAFWLPVVFLFAKLKGPTYMLGDGDTGWHIRTGEWILANGRVPHQDMFSFTKPGQPWFAWEWLWDVIFAWLHQHGGMSAVVLASLLVLSATFALLYRLVRRKSAHPLIAFGVTFLAVSASSIHWLARPHLFTLLGVVVFYGLLERAREGRPRVLWLLPPLMVLWTNLHGGFFLAIVLCLTYAAGELAGWALEADPAARRAALVRSKPYWAAAAGCALASLVNPYFYRLHLHIVHYLTDPFQLERISEFMSISFQHTAARYLEALLALSAAAAALNLVRRRFVYPLLLGFWAHLALISARNIPVFAILAAPLVGEAVEYTLVRLREARLPAWIAKAVRGLEQFGAELGQMESVRRVPLASAAALCLLILMFYFPLHPARLQAQYDPKQFPEKALQALQGEQDRIFTNDVWGGYLIYRLYPKVKVFVDGRSDFYGRQLDEQFLGVMNGKYDWERTLDRYRVNTVLLPAEAPLASTLKQSPRWKVAHDDGVAIVFRPAGPSAPVEAVQDHQRDRRVSAVMDSGGSRDPQVAARLPRDPRITYR